MYNKKIVRVARRVTRISSRNVNNSFPRFIQRSTVKYLPFLYQTVENGYVDLKSFENATVEIMLVDITTVGLNIFLVLWNDSIKNLSKK